MPRRPLQRVQAALVAKRYFIGRQTKSQIADDLGLSRFKVARLIDTAIEDGIVRFVIDEQSDLDAELAEAVRQKYNLKAALILKGSELPAGDLIEPLGALAAQLLEETLVDGQLLGVAWGRTLAAAARAITKLPAVDVIQAAGTPAGLEFSISPSELLHRFGNQSGGAVYPVHGPMWAEDARLMRHLREEPTIASVTARYNAIDVLVVGIGSWRPQDSCLSSSFPEEWKSDAIRQGVRADLCATLIDDQGRAVPSRLDDIGLALSTDQLRRIPEVIGIGGGLQKADAIAAVLRGGWIHTLVTDSAVARHLLA